MSRDDATYVSSFTLVRCTAKAVLLWDGRGTPEDNAVWVPLSQIVELEEVGHGLVEVEMKEWIAREKGFL